MLLTSGYRNKSVILKKNKNRKASSSNWLRRHLNDPYVTKSKLEGYRSRAAYKLIEINSKFNIIKPGMSVVDLGAAPGSWSQVVASIMNTANNNLLSKNNSIGNLTGNLVAVDLLPIGSINGVTCLQNDFFLNETKQLIKDCLTSDSNNTSACPADLVLSDMVANTTGHGLTDYLRTLNLCEEAFFFALEILKPGGHFVAKVFQGGTENSLLEQVKQNFKKVKHFKPDASRAKSREFYLIALDRK